MILSWGDLSTMWHVAMSGDILIFPEMLLNIQQRLFKKSEMHTSKFMKNPAQIVNNIKNGKEWSVSCLPVSHISDASFQS